MGSLIDLTGQTFGELTAIERAESIVGSCTNAMWRCKCSCGKETIVSGYNLRSGLTNSCGHLRYISRRSKRNLTGQTFGDLEVLYRVPVKRGRTMWHCLCHRCGNEIDVKEAYLLNGKKKSCCGVRFEYRSNAVDLTGKQFGNWTVLGRVEHSKDSRRYWNVQCVCGNCRILSTRDLTTGIPASCGCKRKHKVNKKED